ncbi:1,2-dihydroxy-3-keto-5-methylthiopentene dioxygenase 1 [Marasmius oreades]|uniref:Acireductone dioxygenase n=1 Tax=Marasmius oreades TaxID=181124 RepID=A0A9P7RXT6_9AGAR|nr:1,2-dihydroxy-3-keto-5-methylthiopentene dioxygenase 1 [Marasmius oreades]KAG7091420.1 1,2-dihydroxy-3-keto-5-methylthiopentene dioxygenase 1 [Marasmius oreades]
MRAYYFDNLPGDQRLPHDSNPSRPVTTELLKKLKVETFHIPLTDGYQDKIDAIAKERGYKNRDVINISKDGLGDAYEDKIKMFFDEHLHEDEEIRFLVDGSGYFDIRETPTDSWIRIAMCSGDLLVLPAGIYHRFTLDEGNKVEAMRLFKDEPKWAALNRSPDTDHNVHRVEYLKSIAQVA